MGILGRRKETGQRGLIVEIPQIQQTVVLPEQIDALEQEQSGEEGHQVDEDTDQQQKQRDGGGAVEGRDILADRVQVQIAVEQGVVADLKLQPGDALGVVPVLLDRVGRRIRFVSFFPTSGGIKAVQDSVHV